MVAPVWFKRKAAQSVELVVLVAPGGASFGRVRGHPWTARIKADRWRDVDGRLSNEPFTAERIRDDLSDEQASSWSGEWYRAASELSVVRLQGSWDDERATGRHLLLDDLPQPAVDDELAAIADALKRPVVIPHQVFGDFTLNRSVRWFTARPIWRGTTIDVTVGATDDDRLHPETLAETEAFWADIDDWYPRYVECAVEHLFDLKNESWLNDNESPLTVEEFAIRLRPSSISIEDNEAVVFFDDGDVFFGHSIIVSGPIDTGPSDAQLAG